MCEVIPHPGDLFPGDIWLSREDVDVETLDRLADLEESHSDGIDNDVVLEGALRQMASDRCYGFDDVVEAFLT